MVINLAEQDLIREEKPSLSLPVWSLIAIIMIAAFWCGSNWLVHSRSQGIEGNPFLEVTNREYLLFLWQNPGHMRVHAKKKTGYLPAFPPAPNVAPAPELADDYVAAPPDILFLYHTWKRLLGHVYFPRPIPLSEFREFLSLDEEWQPAYWKGAPQEYRELIAKLPSMSESDWGHASESALPKIVRQAFQGWKNYIAEGEMINSVNLTADDIRMFLIEHPNFARNYWQNIYPDYLKTYSKGLLAENDRIPNAELPPFLRAALYNWHHYIISSITAKPSG